MSCAPSAMLLASRLLGAVPAQFAGEGVDRIAAPPPVAHYLLEAPLIPALALAAAGVAAFFVLASRAKGRLGLIVLVACLLAGAAVFGVGTMVETRREVVLARTGELVEVVAAADVPGVDAMLSPDVTVQILAGGYDPSRPTLLADVERYMGSQYRVTDYGLSHRRAVIDGPNAARTQFRIEVDLEGSLYGGRVGSWWLLNWRLEPDGLWRVYRIEAQWIDGVRPNSRVNP